MVSKRGRGLWAVAFVAGIIALIVSGNGLVFGQEFSATMSGVVHDANGGLVPGVNVTAKHIESGLTRTVITSETGSYRMPALPVGEYEVTAELSGFKQQVRRGVTLVVAQEAVVNLTLDVGDLKEQITVTEEAQIVNTTMSSTSGLVTGEQIKNLPLNGRSFLELMRLNSDVITNRSNTANGDQPSFSIAGKRPDQNRFTINGMDYVGNNAAGVYTSPQGISGYLLGVDAVREFNVLGHTYGAEYGKRAGAQVTIVTTSGTNQWRGSVFEYLRNSALDTRNFFDVANAPNPTPVPQFQRNQYGRAFGSGATGWAEKLIGGWQWNAIFSGASGFPITPLVGSNQSGNGDSRNSDVPNLNPNFKGNMILGVDGFKKTGRYFDPYAFLPPTAGTFGSAGRDQIRGPGMWNLDA